MIIVVDGPEAAGKTTLIKAVTELVRTEFGHRFSTVKVRKQGPTPTWTVYAGELAQDYAKPSEFVVWDRSWASEIVYNNLLGRGRPLDEDVIERLLSPFVRESGGWLLMVSTPVDVLRARRLKRIERGDLSDLEVDVEAEMYAFAEYMDRHGWDSIDGTQDIEDFVNAMREGLAADEQV